MNKADQLSIGMAYGQGRRVSVAGAERLSKDIEDHQENRKKLSRRRMTAERYTCSLCIIGLHRPFFEINLHNCSNFF